MKRLYRRILGLDLSVDFDLSLIKISNRNQSLLAIQDLKGSDWCFHNMDWRHVPFPQNAVDETTLLCRTPYFPSLEVWLQIQFATVNASKNSFDVRV